MSDILELPEVRRRVSRLSVAEYHQLGEFNENGKRTELIRGIVIEKMSKSPKHSALNRRIHRMIERMVSAEYTVWKDDPLTFVDSEPEPDVAVVRGEESDFEERHPTTAELVVEVAVSSAALDRENVSLYAEAGVKEYWIVLGKERRVEVYRRLRGGAYLEKTTVAAPETLVCASVPGIAIGLGELFN